MQIETFKNKNFTKNKMQMENIYLKSGTPKRLKVTQFNINEINFMQNALAVVWELYKDDGGGTITLHGDGETMTRDQFKEMVAKLAASKYNITGKWD